MHNAHLVLSSCFSLLQDTSENHPFVVRTVSQAGQPLKASNGLRFEPDYSFEQAPAFDIVVIPGGNLGQAKTG
jgi:transcriptional regulator GlxA family with amidase domain